jgi:hypothetical protein
VAEHNVMIGAEESPQRPQPANGRRYSKTGPLQGWAYEGWAYEDWAYEDWVYEDWVYEDWVYEDWVYEDWAYEDWAYEDWGEVPPFKINPSRRLSPSYVVCLR